MYELSAMKNRVNRHVKADSQLSVLIHGCAFLADGCTNLKVFRHFEVDEGLTALVAHPDILGRIVHASQRN
jgi:hypothetical protein